MLGYQTKQERITIAGVDDLIIRSLLDRLQFFDPRGEAQRIGISSAAWPVFGLLWPSAAKLAARLAARPVRAGERILEIGCGLALAGLVGHRRGANVTVSDFHPLAATFLRKNLSLNGLAPMQYRHGDWNASAASNESARNVVRGQYDLIIGSDVLYDRDASTTLAAFILRHAAAEAEVWIVDPNRSNRARFNQQLLEQGFLLREERLDTPDVDGIAGYQGRLLTYRRTTADSSAPTTGIRDYTST